MGKWEDQLEENGKLTVLSEKDALDAVKENARYIEHIPQNFITSAVVDVCVKAGRLEDVLKYAPPEAFPANFTAICLETIGVYRKNLSKNIVDTAILSDRDFVANLKNLPPALWTPEVSKICLEVLGSTGNGHCIRGIPAERLTVEMCLAAVTNDYRALEFVPDQLKTVEMCLYAVRKSEEKHEFWRTLKFVPRNCLPQEIHDKCVNMIKHEKPGTGGSFLSFVPEHLRTDEMCIASMQTKKSTRDLYDDIPEHLRTQAVVAAADAIIEKARADQEHRDADLRREQEAEVAAAMAEYHIDRPEDVYKKMNDSFREHMPDELRRMMVKANMAKIFPDFVVPEDD